MKSFYDLATRINNSSKFKHIYYALIYSSLIGLSWFIYNSTFKQLITLMSLSFIANQMWFFSIHMTIHCIFIHKTKDDLSFENRFAYDHHYHDTSIFQKYWLPYRLIYFIRFKPTKYILQPTFVSYIVYIFMHQFNNFSSTRNIFFVGAFSMHILLINYQSIVHEWYHTRKSQRKNHFSLLTYCLMSLSEKFGLISTTKHKSHHIHDSEHFDKVKDFFDVWFPCSWVFDKIFSFFKRDMTLAYIFTYGIIWMSYLLQLDLGIYLYDAK